MEEASKKSKLADPPASMTSGAGVPRRTSGALTRKHRDSSGETRLPEFVEARGSIGFDQDEVGRTFASQNLEVAYHGLQSAALPLIELRYLVMRIQNLVVWRWGASRDAECLSEVDDEVGSRHACRIAGRGMPRPTVL